MQWPQIAVVVLLVLRASTAILLHNQPAPVQWWHGVGHSLVLALLLWWGGFFG